MSGTPALMSSSKIKAAVWIARVKGEQTISVGRKRHEEQKTKFHQGTKHSVEEA